MGLQRARSVDVKDVLPVGFTLQNATTSQGQCVGAICQLGDVGVDDVISIVVVAEVNSGAPIGTYTNTAQVFGDGQDSNPDNNVDDIQTDVEHLALLNVSKNDFFDPVDIGGNLIYQISVENLGPSDAEYVIITDTLPDEVSYQADTDSCLHDAGVLTCSLGTFSSRG